MTDIPGIWFPDIFRKVQDLPRITEVKRYRKLSKEAFFEDHASKSAPFILERACDILSQAEVLNIMKTQWAKEVFEVRSSALLQPDAYMARKLEKMSFEDYFANFWTNDPRYYAANNPIPKRLHDSIRLTYPEFYPEDYFNEPRMWLGPQGATTPLHKDIPDNFALNYFGTKQWTIFSPADFPYLYMVNPTPEAVPDYGASRVDIKNPDYSQFPEYRNAQPIELVLNPGDMLYLPAGWGHHVECSVASCLFNFWLLRDKSPAVTGRDK